MTAAEYVKTEFERDSSGHDWWHIHRVRKNALGLCQHEKADVYIVELAALLHDLDDWKLSPSADGTPVRAAAWLRQLSIDPVISAHVCETHHASFITKAQALRTKSTPSKA